MIILAVDSSAVSASAALVNEDRVLGEFYINTRLTHSQTLMPMIHDVLQYTETALDDVDFFAVSAGPGSFTGIRIGIASIKGLAMRHSKPCIGVSTLEAIARNAEHLNGTICAVMDARCQQVYNALFQAQDGILARLVPDRAISIEQLAKECEKLPKPLVLVGDGAKLCYNNPWFQRIGAILPPEPLIYQRAIGVAKTALPAAHEGKTISPAELLPIYLRPAQAERTLKKH